MSLPPCVCVLISVLGLSVHDHRQNINLCWAAMSTRHMQTSNGTAA